MPKKSRKRKSREVEVVEEVFSVEKIVSKKVVKGKTQYLLKWKGYKKKWEPEEKLDCQDLLDEFNRRTAAPKAAKCSSKDKGTVSRAVMVGGSVGSASASSPSVPVSSLGTAVGAASIQIAEEDKVGDRKT